MTAESRFADYVTSGAFALNLTRRQVAALGMFSEREVSSGFGYDALERKGLITVLPREGGRPPEAKITAAGICVAQLCAMAGLTNSAPPEASSEINALHAEIADLRAANAQLAEDSHSLHARAQAMAIKIQELRAEIEAGGFTRPIVTLKDRQPEKCVTAMRFMREADHV